jgi:hypothetical protein
MKICCIFSSGNGGGSWRDDLYLPIEMQVSHTVSQWRKIAICAPCLWTMFNNLIPQTTEMLEMYLERSKACEFDISLTFYEADFFYENLHSQCDRFMSPSLQ